MKLNDCFMKFSILCIFICQVNSIMFELEPNSRKCLKDKTPGNVMISGEYEISPASGQQVDYVITNSKEEILWQQKAVPTGKLSKFIFSSETYDTYEICFISHATHIHQPIKQEVSLKIKKGTDAKNLDGMAEAAKLKPIEVELKQLEVLSVEIVKGFAQMRKNEEEMRDTNEATNTRVFYFSVFSLFCVISLSIWQALYLRRYFKTKKLIE